MAQQTVLVTDNLYSGRAKINDNFTETFNMTGWGSYADSSHTIGSPLSISSGVRATLDNDAVNKIETQIPSDSTTFFYPVTQTIIATNDGDSYNLSIRFKAKMSVNNGYFDIDLDIGGAQGIISQESIVFTRASNTEQRFDIDLTVFSGATFVANGGTLSITPQNGNMEIYDIRFVIVLEVGIIFFFFYVYPCTNLLVHSSIFYRDVLLYLRTTFSI